MAQTAKTEKSGSGSFVYLATAAVNLLSLGLGVGFAWSSPFIPKLNGSQTSAVNPLDRPTTILEDSWIASLLNLGAVVGPLVAGPLSDKLGRKKTLLCFSLPMIASHVIMMFAGNVIAFFAARFLIGMTIGAALSVVPVYLSEISTKENRGFLLLSFSLSNAFGQLLTYAIGPYVTIQTFSMLAALPCLIFLVVFGVFIPETPHFYILTNRNDEAECTLKKIRGVHFTDKEFAEVVGAVEESKRAGKAGLADLLKNKMARRGLIVGMGLMLFQCFSGILAVLSYLQSIFKSTGTTIPDEVAVMTVGAFQLATVLAVSKLVDLIKRRTLLVVSVVGYMFALASLGFYFFLKDHQVDTSSIFWLPIASIIAYFIFFNIGMGPLVWNVAGEIFATNVKSTASTILTVTNIGTGFFVAMLFPSISGVLGMAGTFWCFAAITGLTIPFILLMVPETSGRNLAQIQASLNRSFGEKEEEKFGIL